MTAGNGLYIHVPFCHAKCEYCDFYSITLLDQIEDFVQALLIELELRAAEGNGRQFDTIFMGGGTPSLLSPEQMGRIWETLHRHYDISPAGEFSMESNPGTLDAEKLVAFRSLGFNRISMGVQSFNPEELKFLGRIHSVEDVLENFENARRAGFTNINVDLMTAFPGISEASFQHSLETALSLGAEHLSCYTLIFEPGTILYKRMQKGEVHPLKEEEEVRYYELAARVLGAHGYEQYEISNFAQPGYICQHNLIYWQHQPYLGFGPSAHSFLDGVRSGNKRSLMAYVKKIREKELPRDFSEKLSEKDLVFEHIFLRLRLKEGLNLAEFRSQFGEDFREVYADVLNRLRSDQLIEENDQFIRLSSRGWLLADAVAAYF